MRFAFTDDQKLFASGLRDLLDKECTPAHVRAAWDNGAGHDFTLWNHLAEEVPDLPLPVLVSLCRIRKQDQSSLSVEVFDVRTGETLASREDIFSGYSQANFESEFLGLFDIVRSSPVPDSERTMYLMRGRDSDNQR